MGNIFSQSGLGQMLQGQQEFYSRQQKEKLNRDILRAQAQQHRAKAQQYSDPNYMQSQLPAAIQTGQYYSGLDAEGQRLFRESRGGAVADALAKRGMQYDPMTRQATEMGGFGEALGGLAGAELQGTQDVRAATEPNIQADIAASKIAAGDRAQKTLELNERRSVIPELKGTLKDLDRLSTTATYTTAGRARDLAIKEAGGESQGAIDRVEYDSKIANVILPLLKQTFGAAFTVEEGRKLEATLGDVNASPRQKQAAIKAFLKQRENDIKSRERELGVGSSGTEAQRPTQATTPKKNQKIDGYWFLGGDPADQNNWKKVK